MPPMISTDPSTGTNPNVATDRLLQNLALMVVAATAEAMREAEQRAEMERARAAKEKEEAEKRKIEEQKDKETREKVEEDARRAKDNLPERLREISALPQIERVAALKEVLYELACEHQALNNASAAATGNILEESGQAAVQETMQALAQLNYAQLRAFEELGRGPLASDVQVEAVGIFLAPNEAGDGAALVATNQPPSAGGPEISLRYPERGLTIPAETDVGIGQSVDDGQNRVYLALREDAEVGPVFVSVRYPGEDPMSFSANVRIPRDTVLRVHETLDESAHT